MKYMNKKVFIFDLDDTIVQCQVYYCKVITAFCNKLVEVFDYYTPAPRDILDKQNEIDIILMKKPFTKERFPMSMVLTYQHFHKAIYGNENYNCNVEQEVFNIGMSVFEVIPTPIPNAIETLQQLKAEGYVLYLYTLGEVDVQMRKIIGNGLQEIFDRDNIFITRNKSVNELQTIHRHVMKKYGYIPKENIIMIGDSLKSDIIPALDFGINAVKIKANNWMNSTTDEYQFVEVQNLESAVIECNKEVKYLEIEALY